MTPHFSPFPKIAERPDQWQADEAALRRLARLPWVVSEKIHGANLCIAVEPSGFRVGKRKRWLEPDEDFFGHRRLLARLHAPLLDLARLARQGRDQVASVLVYGELFGGSYPHPQVTPVAEVEPVQTGVWYAPDVHLCILDLALRFEQGDHMEFLDTDRTLALARASGLLAAEPLLVGSYREALDFCERFPSTLPARLGLPSLGASNLAEGVVIRPQRAVTLETARGPVRPLLKRKIDEFAEDERYRGARPWARPVQDPEPALNRLEQEALSLLTPARVAAAVSRVGRQDPQGIAEETLGDLWEDLRSRTPVLANQIEPGDRLVLDTLLLDRINLLL